MLSLNGASIYLFYLSPGLDLSFVFLCPTRLIPFPPLVPTTWLFVLLCVLWLMHPVGLWVSLSFPCSTSVKSAHLHGLTGYLSQSKDMKTALSTEDGQFSWLLVLWPRMQQQRCMLKKHSVIYLHTQALEILFNGFSVSFIFLSSFFLLFLVRVHIYMVYLCFVSVGNSGQQCFDLKWWRQSFLHMKHVYI